MQAPPFAELQAFVAVAERSSFSGAAVHLRMAPSSVSQLVRALEARLAMRLLNRTTRKVSLTDAGEKLFARARPAIAELDAALVDLDQLRGVASGTLRLNVSSVAAEIVLAPRIRSFLELYPAITLDVTVDNDESELISGRFDAGIRVGQRVARDMKLIQVSTPSRFIAVAAPEYLARHGTPATPSQLQQHNCIRLRSKSEFIAWEFEKARQKVEISVSGSLIVNSIELAVRAALEGVGIAYTVESHVAARIVTGRLVPLLKDWAPAHQTYYLYYSDRGQLPAPLEALIGFFKAPPPRGLTPKATNTGNRPGRSSPSQSAE
jgi:DNA-binding transcriptional LysR family regulator